MKTVTISKDLLERLVAAAYDFHPANKAADEGQEILNKLEKVKWNFNDEFLKEVIRGERDRQASIISAWTEDNSSILGVNE